MKRYILVAAFVSMAIACGGGLGGSSKMDISIGGKASSLVVKSSGTDRSVKTFTDVGGKMSTATSFSAVMANYDMDVTNFGTMKKPLTSADQVRVLIQLIGEEGTDQKAEIKAGIYRANPNEKFMKVDSVTVATFADGKETTTSFDTMFSGSKITGQIEVTSVSATSITGKIDVSEGDKTIKGSFTANIAVKK